MVDTHTHGCPGPEVLAAYVDHGLSLAERARVEGHLASCPQCTALLAGVLRTAAEIAGVLPQAVETAESSPLVTWRAVAGACAAAAAVIAVLAAPSLLRPWLERDAGLVSLASSVGEQRSVLGRLTGGFPHAPLDVSSAGGQDDRAAGTDRVLLTAGRIRESVGETATPSRLHALGVSQLLARRYDDAAQLLLAASREQPANARYLNDVAAVQLERARRGLRPDDLPRALAAADRARRLDPSLREAWFNRALAISALSLTDQAKAAWTEYLRRDSSSPWASEARKRLEELSNPTPAEAWAQIEGRLQQTIDPATADLAVRTQTTEARQFIENVLFVEWANAVLAGNDGAAELDRVRVMSEAMLRVSGDALYRDAVTAIDRAASRDMLESLAEAHRNYASAAQLFNDDRFAAALPSLQHAQSRFAALGSPYQLRAAVDIATIGYVSTPATVKDSLQSIAKTAQSADYNYIAARAVWIEGLLAVTQGRLGEAQSHYDQTLATFERMGDVEQAGNAHNLLATLANYLGDSAMEWRHRVKAFEVLPFSRSPRFKYMVTVAAAAATRTTSPETALELVEAVLVTAHEWGRDAAIAESLAQRASIMMVLGRDADAANNLVEARRILTKISDPQFKSRIEVVVLAAESDLHRRSNPAASASAATRAIEIVEQRRDRLRLAQLNLRLARANITGGRLKDAELALARGISQFEEERASLSDEGRISTLDESWQLFEAAVQLAIHQRDYPRAFAMAERARVRTLSESKRLADVPSLAEAERSLTADQAIIALNQFEDELAVWVIKNSGTSVLVRPITRRDAQHFVSRQRDEIALEARIPEASALLFDELIRPAAAMLRGIARIAVVADAPYQDASFAALYDRSKKQFLVERVSLVNASTATAVSAFNRSLPGPATDVLVLAADDSAAGDPAEIAAAYSQADVLTGSSVTRKNFLQRANNRSVLHLRANTTDNAGFPMLSRLVLSDESGQRRSGVVLGRDIAATSFSNIKLVVLDEAGDASSQQRAHGLARAFMVGGVPAVVGTLPGIDQAAARQLFVGLHREVASGAAAGDALSRIQRNAIQQNGGRLGAWTALVLYGSDR